MATRGDTIRRAIALKSDEDVVEALRERLPDSLEMLARIACGDVPRNAQSILKAIETQLRFTQPLPKQTVEHQGSVGFAILDPYAQPPEEQQLPPAPPPVAVGPVVRRKATAPALPPAGDVVLCGRCGQPTSEAHECATA